VKVAKKNKIQLDPKTITPVCPAIIMDPDTLAGYGSALLKKGIIPIKSIDRPICEQKTGNMLRPINENG
jgi:hypothetical protein